MSTIVQVIPVTDAMREPHKFPKVLTGVMISLMCKWLEHFMGYGR